VRDGNDQVGLRDAATVRWRRRRVGREVTVFASQPLVTTIVALVEHRADRAWSSGWSPSLGADWGQPNTDGPSSTIGGKTDGAPLEV
jgi:hypothetical protein